MEHEKLVQLARLAEQVERYEDMADSMRQVIQLGNQLNNEERNLFSIAFKNVIGPRRTSCRLILCLLDKYEQSDPLREITCQYRDKVQQELVKICREVLNLLDQHLIAKTEDVEGKVFYLKMSGDYYRYLAEVMMEEEKPEVVKAAENAYKAAYELSKKELSVTNPIHLGLALNFSVFYYEILNSAQVACDLARSAFEEAVVEIDNLTEDAYKDSTMIMQLLRDNLSLWTSETSPETQTETS